MLFNDTLLPHVNYLQVHVWGGISRRGATQIRIFTGIMDSVIYQGILKDHLKVLIYLLKFSLNFNAPSILLIKVWNSVQISDHISSRNTIIILVLS